MLPQIYIMLQITILSLIIIKLIYTKKRRYSTRFDKEQTRVLKEWYEANRDKPYASDEIINKLAERINLEPRSVRKWMSNKRTRLLETRTFRKKY